MSYIVQPGESIWDVTLNATGSLHAAASLDNLDAVLEANDMEDWVPDIFPGQVIAIPDTAVPDLNALRSLQAEPLCNNSVSDILEKIIVTFDLFTSNWILTTGFWNDSAIWIDTKTWID